jgi:hypothetical protein
MTDAHAYCRAVEAHLCRRNGGHLIRIVGPAFDVVKGWAESGIPLTVACAGIDRVVDRAARRPGRRRPMRVEFCEADVRAAHDEWVRAVGSAGVTSTGTADAAAARPSITHHIDRAVAQLTALRAPGRSPATLEPALAGAVGALEMLRAPVRTARGAAREALVAQLQDIDTALTRAAVEVMSDADRAALRREAEAEIAAFRTRLPQAQWEAALLAAGARLARLRLGLPLVAYE